MSCGYYFEICTFPQPPLQRKTKRRNPQQRKEAETVASATELMEMDITKMSEIDFKVTIMKAISGLEKNISDNIESLRAEMRCNQAKLKNAMNEMQSQLGALTARVNEAEERISELEDEMIEKKEREETWLKKKTPLSRKKAKGDY